jgi:hypothetical protein
VAVAIDHSGDDDHAGGIDDDRIPGLARASEVGTDSGDALALDQDVPAAKLPTPVSIEMMVPPRIRMRRLLSPAARRSRSSVASAPCVAVAGRTHRFDMTKSLSAPYNTLPAISRTLKIRVVRPRHVGVLSRVPLDVLRARLFQGPDDSGSNPGSGCTHNPEKSGMNAALSLPSWAALAAGAAACPKADVTTAAASMNAKRKFRHRIAERRRGPAAHIPPAASIYRYQLGLASDRA